MAKKPNEPFTHRTSIGSMGEILYDAPIEIHDQQDLDNYHITWKQCITFRFGGHDPRSLYFIQTPNRELAEYLWHDLNNDHTKRITLTRCMIPGERKDYKICPTSNSCEHCPFGVKPEQKKLNTISWTKMNEEAWEHELNYNEDDDPCGKPVSPVQEIGDTNIMLEDLKSIMTAEDSRLFPALEMKEIRGMSVEEIAITLGCSQPRVYQLIKQAKAVAKAYIAGK